MVKKKKPEAVTVFNSIFDHLKVVEYCASKGIHIMVEKPLAVNFSHATKMASLAKKHMAHLLTNYETSWYGSNHKAYQLIHEEKKGSTDFQAGPMKEGFRDPFAYLAKVVKENYQIPSYVLSSIENNLMVMQIFDAAKMAAQKGKTLLWENLYDQD